MRVNCSFFSYFMLGMHTYLPCSWSWSEGSKVHNKSIKMLSFQAPKCSYKQPLRDRHTACLIRLTVCVYDKWNMSYPLHVKLFSSIIRNQSSIYLRGYLDLKLNSKLRYYRHSSSQAKPLIRLLSSCKSDTWLAKMWGSIQNLEKKTKEEPIHDSHSSI